jgi:integrase
LRALKREAGASDFVFTSERGAPFTTDGFAKLIERAGKAAGIEVHVHPHMLRHAAGYALGARIPTTELQAFLGHKDIRNTVSTRYAALARREVDPGWRNVFEQSALRAWRASRDLGRYHA